MVQLRGRRVARLGVVVVALLLLLSMPMAAARAKSLGRRQKVRNRKSLPAAEPFCDPLAGRWRLPQEELSQIYEPLALPVGRAVCDYLTPLPTPRLSLGRWTPRVHEKLWPLHQQIQQAVAAVVGTTGSSITLLDPEPGSDRRPWKTFVRWLGAVASESEAFEIRGLVAPIFEAMWQETMLRYGVYGTASLSVSFDTLSSGYETEKMMLSQMGTAALDAYKQAGLITEAERVFRKMMDYEEGKGNHPYRFIYDTADARRVSAYPWPGLSPLTWPDPYKMLPSGVGEELVAAHAQIAKEADSVLSSGRLVSAGDAYPSIATKKQWTKVTLYTARTGWDEQECAHVPTVCTILRGRLRTEREPAQAWYKTGHFVAGDEAVILFRVSAGGLAHLHQGQDARINVHLCLLNCDDSAVVVGGSLKNYTAGSLLAFEDRADHEIINIGKDDRVSLTVGVLHPDYDVSQHEHPSPHAMLTYYLRGSNASQTNPMPVRTLTGPLVLAAYYGYSAAVQQLLEKGADGDAMNMQGIAAVHAACFGIGREIDKTRDLPTRVDQAFEVLRVLAHYGADLTNSAGWKGDLPTVCQEVAARVGDPSIMIRLAKLRGE